MQADCNTGASEPQPTTAQRQPDRKLDASTAQNQPDRKFASCVETGCMPVPGQSRFRRFACAGTCHGLHLRLWRLMCCSASSRRLMRLVSMLSRKLSSCSFWPTNGLELHSRSPAANASSIGAEAHMTAISQHLCEEKLRVRKVYGCRQVAHADVRNWQLCHNVCTVAARRMYI